MLKFQKRIGENVIRLSIDPLMFGLTIAVFLLLILLLNNWLYKPMLTYIKDRDGSIKNDLTAANNNDSNVKILEEEINSIMSQAKIQAKQLRQKMFDDAKLLASNKIETKRNELAKEYLIFTDKLKLEHDSLKNTLLSKKADFHGILKSKFSQI